jgi:hypothetical protein
MSNTRGSISGAIPMPVSRIETVTPCGSRRVEIEMRPPPLVYFAALFSRLLKTCVSRPRSPSSSMGSPRPSSSI